LARSPRVTGVDRTAIEAELEVPGSRHVASRARVFAVHLAEALVLPLQRLHVRQRVTNRNHEAGIGEQPQQIGEPCDVVIAFRQISRVASQP
jgi:hypothetical protein